MKSDEPPAEITEAKPAVKSKVSLFLSLILSPSLG
jgi:hypothetical protein